MYQNSYEDFHLDLKVYGIPTDTQLESTSIIMLMCTLQICKCLLLQNYNKNFVVWILLLWIVVYYRLLYFWGEPFSFKVLASSQSIHMLVEVLGLIPGHKLFGNMQINSIPLVGWEEENWSYFHHLWWQLVGWLLELLKTEPWFSLVGFPSSPYLKWL